MNHLELKAEVIRAGFSITSFAGALNMSRTAIYRKMRGTSEFKQSEIVKIKNVLNLTPEMVKTIFFDT